MKKKNKLVILLATICSLSFIGACSTSKDTSGKEIGEAPDYEWTYAPTMADPCDEDMVIDGVLDEARWQGQQKLEHTEKGIKTTYTTIFTEKGLYIGAVAEDSKIEWTERLRYEENSCFWFSVKGAHIDTTSMKGTEVFNFYVDGKDASSLNHARYQAKGKTDKPYEEKPGVLTAELFVTWDALNIELGENGELPEFVWINPHYRFVGSADRDTWLNPLLFFDNNDRQQCSGRFGEVGYINVDKENAVLGNAANGHSKSDGWDLTDIENGSVTSEVDHCQAIFFTDVYSDAYIYTVEAEVLSEKCNGKYGEVGVVDMVDEVAFHSFFLYQDSLLKKDFSKYATLSLYGTGFGGWTWVDSGVMKPEYSETDSKVKFTVIKDGGYFYYIVGDKLVMSKYVEYLDGASCPGLFALDCKAKFTAYEATDLSATPEKVDELLEEYGVYRVKKPDVISGGSLELATTAVLSGGNVNMTVTANNGFVLTGFTVNGEDKYAEVAEKLDKGQFTLENVTQTTEIVPTFTRIPDAVRVSGKIYVKDTTKPVLGATATVWGNNPLLYYSNATASNGTYTFTLPKAGTQTIGGREFTFDGKYTFKAKASGYLSANDTFTLTEDGSVTKDYEMAAPIFDEWNWDVVGEDGFYTPSGTHYYTSAHSYTSRQKSTQVVYSVKISAPLGLTGYRGQLPNVGVTITDNNVLAEKTTNQNVSFTHDREVFSARIGLSNVGVVAHTLSIAHNARRLDRPVSDRWNFSTLNEDAAFSSSTTERTLTVVINNDTVFVYVDNKYICEVSLLDTNYFFGVSTFKAGSEYTVGVNTTNIDHTATPITFEVLTEAYGADASTLIQNAPEFLEVRSKRVVNVTKIADKEYEFQSGWMKYGYVYTTEKPTDAAVYSVRITAGNDLIGSNNWFTNVGITFSNGDTIGSDTWYTFVDTARITARTGNEKWLSGGQIGFNGVSSNYVATGEKYIGLSSGIMSSANERYYHPNGLIDGVFEEKTLTVLLYQGNLYVFVDDVYVTKVSLDDKAFDYKNGNNEEKTLSSSDKLIFGIAAVNVAEATSVSAKIEKELYGADALAEFEENELYKQALNGPEPLNTNVNITKNEAGEYVLPSGWMKYGYVYTTEIPTDTAVYSVKFKATNDLIGSNNWFTNVGITFSNGQTMGTDGWYALSSPTKRAGNEKWMSGGQIGFNGASVNGVSTGNKYVGLSSGVMTKANERFYGSVDLDGVFTEKTLTLLLFKGEFYIYVNDVYVNKVSADEAVFDYVNANGEAREISSNDKFYFGVAGVNIGEGCTITAKVEKELYGADALKEIEENELYALDSLKLKASGVTKNTDGSYTLGKGWMNYSYAYTTSKATDTAVYSVKISTSEADVYGQSWFGHVGIVFSNGDVMGSANWTDANSSTQGNRPGNESYLSGGLIGICGQNAANSNKYLSLTSGIMSKWNERYYNFETSEAFTEKTLTVVLYKGTLYVYVDGAYKTSVSLDNAAFDYVNGNGEAKNIQASDKLIFGIAAVNMAVTTKATVVQQLQDAAALEYIQANYADTVPMV